MLCRFEGTFQRLLKQRGAPSSQHEQQHHRRFIFCDVGRDAAVDESVSRQEAGREHRATGKRSTSTTSDFASLPGEAC